MPVWSLYGETLGDGKVHIDASKTENVGRHVMKNMADHELRRSIFPESTLYSPFRLATL